MIYFRARSNNRQIICPEHFWCWAMSNAGTESNELADHVVFLMTAKDHALWPIFHFPTELHAINVPTKNTMRHHGLSVRERRDDRQAVYGDASGRRTLSGRRAINMHRSISGHRSNRCGNSLRVTALEASSIPSVGRRSITGLALHTPARRTSIGEPCEASRVNRP